MNDRVRLTRLAIESRDALSARAVALQKALDDAGVPTGEERIEYLKAMRHEVCKLILEAPTLAPSVIGKWRHQGAPLL